MSATGYTAKSRAIAVAMLAACPTWQRIVHADDAATARPYIVAGTGGRPDAQGLVAQPMAVDGSPIDLSQPWAMVQPAPTQFQYAGPDSLDASGTIIYVLHFKLPRDGETTAEADERATNDGDAIMAELWAQRGQANAFGMIENIDITPPELPALGDEPAALDIIITLTFQG
jgi:hypothetical protein